MNEILVSLNKKSRNHLRIQVEQHFDIGLNPVDILTSIDERRFRM